MPDETLIPEFSRLHPVERIGLKHTRIHLEATPEECVALTRRLKIPALYHLKANVTLSRHENVPGFSITGSIDASLRLNCVVTLEDFDTVHRSEFSERFAPSAVLEKDDGFFDSEADDAPEPFDDAEMDIGELVVQFLALNLDPYPRKPDAILLQQLPEKLRDIVVTEEQAAKTAGTKTTGEPDKILPFANLAQRLKSSVTDIPENDKE